MVARKGMEKERSASGDRIGRREKQIKRDRGWSKERWRKDREREREER